MHIPEKRHTVKQNQLLIIVDILCVNLEGLFYFFKY